MMDIEICSLCGSPRPCCCQRENRRANPKAEPRWRSKRYLKFVRSLPCCIMGCVTWHHAEPHHAGPRGVGEKVDDWACIPLCRAHHEEAHKYGRDWAFYRYLRQYQLQTLAAAISAGVLGVTEEETSDEDVW